MKKVNRKLHVIVGERSRVKLLLVRLPNHFTIGIEVQTGPEDASLPHADGWIVFALNLGLWAVGLIFQRKP